MVALATSAKPEEIEHLQDLIGARDALDVVIGSQDVERSKPAPDLFQVTLERCGLDAGDAVAVGDSRWDIEAAAQIGLRCIAVLTGGNGAAELWETGAVAVYEDVAELLRKLDESPLEELLRA